MSRRKVLLVCYGGGHVRMVLPLARALQAEGGADPVVLALTNAGEAVREAPFRVIQFKDFLEPGHARARAWGEELLAGMEAASIDRAESIAYLGLSFADLVDQVGEAQARERYARQGRQAFLPVGVLERIIRHEAPAVVVSTSSPRAEHAAFLAARRLGVPSLCLIDSFLQDEAVRLGQRDYADRTCVFNESVRQLLISHGARPDSVRVTGNPAFDVLLDDDKVARGRARRTAMGWDGRTVFLVPAQRFHPYHPVAGHWPEHDLPQRMQATVFDWVQAHERAVLCIRPRPGEPEDGAANGQRVHITGRDWPLPELLHAVDVVVTVNSTVGLEGHLAGARVVQLIGTPFDDSSPWLAFGIADRAVRLPDLPATLDQLLDAPRKTHVRPGDAATPRVMAVLRELMR